MTSTVYILGSGFSASFGLPTLNGLFEGIMQSRQRPGERDQEEVLQALGFLYPHFDKNHPIYPPFEEYLTLVEAADAFGGSFFDKNYWRDKIISSKRLLTDYIAKKSDVAEKSSLLKDFVRKLNSNDIIITFNWDTLIETCCLDNDVSVDLNKRNSQELTLLKLHGSLSWGATPKDKELTKPTTASWLWKDEVFLVKKHKYFDEWDQLERGPLIVPPTSLKRPIQSEYFESLWHEAFNSLVEAETIVIIGYSLPPDDVHARTLLVSGMNANINECGITLVDPDASVAARYFSRVTSRIQYRQVKFDESILSELQ